MASAGDARGGVALPDNAHHRRKIDQVRAARHRAGIVVVWVNDNLDVEIDAADREDLA